MALLRKLRESDDQSYGGGSSSKKPEASPAAFNALGALEEMMGGGSTSSQPAIDDGVATASKAVELPPATSPQPQPAAPVPADVARRSTVHGSPVDGSDAPEVGLLLEQVGPIFQAALVFPGASAPPTEFAASIRKMSETTAALTRHIVQASKDADEAWALQRVQPTVARLVAEEWRIVATQLPSGDGREAALFAAVSVERLRQPVVAALDVRGLLQTAGGETPMPLEAVATVARLCSEASMYSARVEQFVPGLDVSPDLFLLNAVQFSQTETAGFLTRFPAAGRDVSAAFLIHALQSVALAFGRHSRGLMRAMAEADGDAKRGALVGLISSDAFKRGFPTTEILSDARIVVSRMSAMIAHVLRAMAGERA